MAELKKQEEGKELTVGSKEEVCSGPVDEPREKDARQSRRLKGEECESEIQRLEGLFIGVGSEMRGD